MSAFKWKRDFLDILYIGHGFLLADGAVNKDLAGLKLEAGLSPTSQIQFETFL